MVKVIYKVMQSLKNFYDSIGSGNFLFLIRNIIMSIAARDEDSRLLCRPVVT
mgnify:CR=1 FL=1|jgi:hypothetical protein